MSDPVSDALDSVTTTAPQPDAVSAALDTAGTQTPHQATQPPVNTPWWQKVIGFPAAYDQELAHEASGLAGQVAGGLVGLGSLPFVGAERGAGLVKSVSDALTYEPRGEEGQEVSRAYGNILGSDWNPLNWPDVAGRKAGDFAASHGAPPLVSTGLRIAPDAAAMLGGLRSVPETKGVINSVDNPQSLGAAAASPNLAAASPELREAIRRAQQNGEPINPQILERHVQAESLPIPARLTKGQATQDPILISQEQNQRGMSNGAFSKHFNQQNQNLVENLQTLRDQIGPDVHTTNQTEHADTLIAAYKAKNKAAQADIAAKYKALKDANGGQFPVDAKALLQNTTAALHQKLLFEHAPPVEMGQLQQAADTGNMTFEKYEAMRTNLARIMRNSKDGNEVAAAQTMRQQMEALPLQGAAANLKPLADTARASALAQFSALEADPAYKAAVTESVLPDRFVSRFIINGGRDDVAMMRKNIGSDPVVQQTMGTAVLEHLRKSARINDDYNGNFAQAGFNNALQGQATKLAAVFTPKQIEDLRNLGDVARYEQAQPRGSFVNNSNTATSLLAEQGKSLAEQVVNAKTLGVGGTIARKILKGRAEKALAAEHLAPGAGITYSGSTP